MTLIGDFGMKKILSVCKRLFSVMLGCAALLGSHSIAAAENFRERGLENIAPDTGSLLPIQLSGSGMPIKVYVPKNSDIREVAISKDGHYIATTDGSQIITWDANTGRQLQIFQQPEGAETDEDIGFYNLIFGIAPFAYSASSLSHQEDHLSFFQSDSIHPIIGRISTLGGRFPLALSDDNRYLYYIDYSYNPSVQASIKIKDLSENKIIRYVICQGIVLAFSADQRYALCAPSKFNRSSLTAKNDNSLRIIELSSGRESRRLVGHQQPITAGGFSQDGTLIFSASHDGTMRVWDATSGNPLKVIKVLEPVVRKSIIPGSEPDVIGVQNAAMSPDGNYIVAHHTINDESGSRETITIWDRTSGRKLHQFDGAGPLFCIFPDSRRLFLASMHAPRAVKGMVLELPSMRLLVSLQWFPSYVDAYHGNNKALGFSSASNKIFYLGEKSTLSFDLLTANLSRFVNEHASDQLLSKDGKRLFLAHPGVKNANYKQESPELDLAIIDSATMQQVGRFNLKSGRTMNKYENGITFQEPVSIRMRSISHDGSILLTTASDGVVGLWDMGSGRENRISANQNCANHPCINVLSLDGKLLLLMEQTNSGAIRRLLSMPDGKEIASAAFREPGDPVNVFYNRSTPIFSPDSTQFADSFLSNEITKKPTPHSLISVYSSHSAMQLHSIQPIIERYQASSDALQWSRDGKTLLLTGGDTLVHIESVSGKVMKAIRLTGEHSGSAPTISPDDRLIANLHGIWDAQTGDQRIALAMFNDGEEWVVMTPEGYYNSSEHGHQYINMRRGNEVYGAEQLYDVFYRPDLVIKKLRGEDIRGDGKLLTIDEALANPPPMPEILGLTPKGNEGVQEVSFRLQGKGGGIGEVRLFHNRKLVHRLDAKLAGAASYEGKVGVQGVAGDNEVTVMGMNQQNSVQGMMRSQGFSVAGAGKRPRAYVLAVGIGQYRAGKDTLPFAVSDARQMAAALQKGLGTLYPPEEVQVEVIADSQATRQGILDRFERLKAVVQPGDQFVLFFASHGLLSNGKYYVVTHDFDGAFDPAKGLSSEELMEASREIRALHQLLIFDTCHAGGMDQTVTATYDARMSVLARQMGLHLFAAASPLEKAVEGYQGRGLFTHTLLEGLSRGPMVDADHDQTVTVKELGEYVKGRMNEIQQEIGLRQTPRILNVGQDKGLYRVGGAAVIPTTTQTPVALVPIPPPATKGLMINTGAGVSLRSAPNRSASKRLLLSFGQVVTLMERQTQSDETWCRVSTAEGGEGWIPINFLADFQREKAPSTYARIAREKLAATSQFGDLVEVGNFLSNVETNVQEARDLSELKALRLQAFRKTYAAIPPSGRNDSPYREWIQEHQGQPGWAEITRP